MNDIVKKYVGAVDQGTTSTRFVIFNRNGEMVAMHQIEHQQIYPKPDWVEHDPEEIKDNAFLVIKEAVKKAGIQANELAAIGVTNQRETTVVWDRATGKPLPETLRQLELADVIPDLWPQKG